VLGHLGLNVADLDAARRYWTVLMPMLGFEPFLDDADQIAYRPADGKRGTYVFIYGALDGRAYSPDAVGLQHLAFMVRTRQAVHDAYRAALELGSEAVHEPQVFPQYPQPYFAAFWRDQAGFTIEAVCHHDR
jgi:catechol 2,3-dioxygenase-like lactoylglutathione lyase family enzyme